MRRLILVFLALQAGAASAAAQDAPAMAPPTPAVAPSPLHMAIMRYFKTSGTADTSQFDTATTDLNGDGIDDAVVIVRGYTWCSSDGDCSMLVFRGTTSGFRFISKSLVANAPVRVSTAKAHGWKTLIVHSRENGDKLLPYDGRVYPISSAGQRPATGAEVIAATLLINGR